MVTVSGTNSTDLVGRYNMVQGLQESDIANLDDVASEVGSRAYFNDGSEAVQPHAASSGQPIPGQVSVPLTPSAFDESHVVLGQICDLFCIVESAVVLGQISCQLQSLCCVVGHYGSDSSGARSW